MTKNVKIAGVVIAILIVVTLLVLPRLGRPFGTISSTDVTATRYTQLLVDNGIQVTANGINVVAGGLSITAGGLTNTSGVQSNASVQTQTVRQTLVSGTSTPCSIANPFTATSTVVSFSMNITTATSSAISWVVGTSTTAFATSSSMLTQAVVAGAQQTLAISPTSGNTISSGSFVLVGPGVSTVTGTGAFTSIVLGGTCQAVFQTAN